MTSITFFYIIKCMINNITFDGETLNIELKNTFRALQRVKNETTFDPKIEQNRTPSNLVIAIKNDVFETSFKNGATDGLDFEPNCVRLVHYSLHDTDTMSNMKMLLYPSNKAKLYQAF